MDGFMTWMEYLAAHGGGDSDTATLKKAYRREYMRHYKRHRRKQVRDVHLGFESGVYRRYLKEARRHGLTLPAFIYKVLGEYVDGQRIITHPDCFARLKTDIAITHSELRFIAERVMEDGGADGLKGVLERIGTMENELESLFHPKDLRGFLGKLLEGDDGGIRDIMETVLSDSPR